VNIDPDQISQGEIPIANSDVPTFRCIVYVGKVDGGGTRVHVANLADASGNMIEASGASEREALGKIIPLFKKTVTEFHQGDTEIPWIDPVPDPSSGEQKRFVPVHL
jgi:hypothetical protein